MNDSKFSRLENVVDPWKKTETPPPVKREKSVRLTIDLDSNGREASGYIFSYEKLVKKAKAQLESAKADDKCGSPEFISMDEQLKNIASRYEKKYRYQTYADLGEGYDEDDSFIDNTEANEEGIPEEMDTKKGGFYINSGTLELTKR